mgnify:CR=1 FL=1
MYDCYNNIIGLSNIDCDCEDVERPEDYDVSLSGLYISSLAPVSALVQKCSQTIWDQMNTARDEAVKAFVADTNALIGKKLQLKRPLVYNSVVGEIKSKYTYSASKNLGVIRIACCPIRSGVMKLNSLGTVFSTVGAFTVDLYDNVDGFIESIPVTTATNKVVTIVGDEYPMYSKYVDVLEYYLVFTFDDNNKPKDTKIDCGCGSTWVPKFDTGTPYYNSTRLRKRMEWASYCMVGSVEIDSVAELDDMPTTMSNKMMGIFLDMDFGCKISEILCKDSLDFQSNPLALSMALAIQYRAAMFVADVVSRPDVLTRDNMIDGDSWDEDYLMWREGYNQQVNFVASQVNHQNTDCFSCRDVLGMTRQGLFS